MPAGPNSVNANAALLGAVNGLTEQLVVLSGHIQQLTAMGSGQAAVQQQSAESVAAAANGPRQTQPYGAQGTPDPQPYKGQLEQFKALRSQGQGVWQSFQSLGRQAQPGASPAASTPPSTPPGPGGDYSGWGLGPNLPPQPPPPPIGGEPSGSGSYPPDATGTTGTVQPQPLFAGALGPGGSSGPLNTEQALAMGVLGEHGGPAFMRNAYLGTYAIQQQLGWAQQSAAYMGQQIGQGTLTGRVMGAIPGVSAGTMAGLSGMFGIAAQHPVAAYAALSAVQGIGNVAGSVNTSLGNWQTTGAGLGYGGTTGPAQYIFGMHDPLSYLLGSGGTATAEGASLQYSTLASQGLIPGRGFGGGLSRAQASSSMAAIAGSGFSNQQNSMNAGTVMTLGASDAVGDTLGKIPIIGSTLTDFATQGAAALAGGLNDLLSPLGINWFQNKNTGGGNANNILSQFMEPVERETGGAATAADLQPFLSALRQASTSTSQLSDTFSDLNQIAQATNESIPTVLAGFGQVEQTAEGMGATQQQGLSYADQFSASTGLPVQFASGSLQSPLIQGLMMSQSGILPSGMAGSGGGTVGLATGSAIQMMQHAFAGLDRTQYKTLSNGQRVPIIQGSSQMNAQIASQLGIPQSEVQQYEANPKEWMTGSSLEQTLGSSGLDSGLWAAVNALPNGQLSQKQLETANKNWAGFAGKDNSNLKALGMSKADIAKLADTPDSRKGEAARLNMMNKYIQEATGQTTSKIKSDPTNVNVSIGFTGAAAKFFQQTGISTNQAAANAGQTAINAAINSPQGDNSPIVRKAISMGETSASAVNRAKGIPTGR